MFERYTQPAQSSIIASRFEAFGHGSQEVEPEHLLLGLLANDEFLRAELSEEAIRRVIEARTPRISGSTNMSIPLSLQSKHVLALANEEAERLGHNRIVCLHLALGLLRQPESFAAELMRGLEAQTIRERVATSPE